MADRDDKFRWGQRENTRSNSPSREIDNPTLALSRRIEKPTFALSRGLENPTLVYRSYIDTKHRTAFLQQQSFLLVLQVQHHRGMKRPWRTNVQRFCKQHAWQIWMWLTIFRTKFSPKLSQIVNWCGNRNGLDNTCGTTVIVRVSITFLKWSLIGNYSVWGHLLNMCMTLSDCNTVTWSVLCTAKWTFSWRHCLRIIMSHMWSGSSVQRSIVTNCLPNLWPTVVST